MNKLVLGAAAALFVSGVAYAADPMALFNGNTLVGKDASGMESKTLINADKTYTTTDSKGTKGSGMWADEAGKMCFMPKVPAPAAGKEKSCTSSFAGHKVGDSFEVVMDDGAKYSAKIVTGR